MAENIVKRTTVFQVHCNACDNDTIHDEKGDVVQCGACHITELWYVIEREGRVQEIAAPTKEKPAQKMVTTRDKVANPKEILAKV